VPAVFVPGFDGGRADEAWRTGCVGRNPVAKPSSEVCALLAARWQPFRLLGIPVRFDASWLIILALLTLSLASAFPRHKRLLGSAPRGRSDAARERECYLRVLTHDLMILAGPG
jgi:hypothetical protein